MSFAGRLSTEKNLKTPIAKKITGKIIFAVTEKFLFQVRIIEIKIIAEQDRIKILICGEKNSANKIPAVKNAVSTFRNAFEIFIFIVLCFSQLKKNFAPYIKYQNFILMASACQQKAF